MKKCFQKFDNQTVSLNSYQFLKMNIPIEWDKKKLARKYLIKLILKEAKDSRAILAKKKCEEMGKSWTKMRIFKWSNNSVWRLPNSTNYLSIKTVKYTIYSMKIMLLVQMKE